MCRWNFRIIWICGIIVFADFGSVCVALNKSVDGFLVHEEMQDYRKLLSKEQAKVFPEGAKCYKFHINNVSEGKKFYVKIKTTSDTTLVGIGCSRKGELMMDSPGNNPFIHLFHDYANGEQFVFSISSIEEDQVFETVIVPLPIEIRGKDKAQVSIYMTSPEGRSFECIGKGFKSNEQVYMTLTVDNNAIMPQIRVDEKGEFVIPMTIGDKWCQQGGKVLIGFLRKDELLQTQFSWGEEALFRPSIMQAQQQESTQACNLQDLAKNDLSHLEGKIVEGRYFAPKNIFSCRAEDFGEGNYAVTDMATDFLSCVGFYDVGEDFKRAEVLLVSGLDKQSLKDIVNTYCIGVLKEGESAKGIESLKEEIIGTNAVFVALSIQQMPALKKLNNKDGPVMRGYLVFLEKGKVVILSNQIAVPIEHHKSLQNIENLRKDILEFRKTFKLYS